MFEAVIKNIIETCSHRSTDDAHFGWQNLVLYLFSEECAFDRASEVRSGVGEKNTLLHVFWQKEKGKRSYTKGEFRLNIVIIALDQNVEHDLYVALFEIQSAILYNHSLLLDIKLEPKIIKTIFFGHVLINYLKY